MMLKDRPDRIAYKLVCYSEHYQPVKGFCVDMSKEKNGRILQNVNDGELQI